MSLAAASGYVCLAARRVSIVVSIAEVLMTDSPARQIAARVREQHELVLKCVRDLDEAQLAAPPGAHAPAIRFHLWHIARWADIVGAHLPTMGLTTAAD